MFGEVQVLYGLGLHLEGFEEGLDDKKKKDWGHIITLMDTGGIVDFGVFYSDLDFNSAIIIKLFYILYDGWM